MIRCALESVVVEDKAGRPLLDGTTLDVAAGTHVALLGASGTGKSLILETLAGMRRVRSGIVRLGDRVINSISHSRLPLAHTLEDLPLKPRWTVRHLLVSAARVAGGTAETRRDAIEAAAMRWNLELLLDRRASTLSSTERALTNVARLDLMRRPLVLAERLLAGCEPAAAADLESTFFGYLRERGTTVVYEPSTARSFWLADEIVVIAERGRVLQRGTPREVYARPQSVAAALATGEVNLVPVTLEGTTVHSPLGDWTHPDPQFSGRGVAVVRPADIEIAERGTESDFVLAVESVLQTGSTLRVRGGVTRDFAIELNVPLSSGALRGRLLPVRLLTTAVTLLPETEAGEVHALQNRNIVSSEMTF